MTSIQTLIKEKNTRGLVESLTADPSLANIGWPFDEKNTTLAHPLHRLCDAVFDKSISEDYAIEVATILLGHGANINGYVTEEKIDTPLIAAASLNAEQLGLFYIERGANIFHAGCHGGTALHWAAWCGKDLLVRRLIDEGAEINKRCIDFNSTPLFWAIHGFVQCGRENEEHYIKIVKALLHAGADKTIPNAEGYAPASLLNADDKLLNLLR